MRLFVALSLPAPVRLRLSWLAGQRYASPAFRRVAEENLHLTLCFLGERGKDRVPGIRDALARVRHPAFRVGLDAWGAFGRRVFFAGVGEGRDQVFSLARAVHEALLEPFARFHAHVTVARARRAPPPLSDAPLPRLSFHARAFSLYASRPTPAGPRYRCLARYPLQKGRSARENGAAGARKA